MIKILFMIHDLGQGGAEKVLVNLVNNLDKAKFDITLVSLFGGGINEQFLNKDIRYQVIFPKVIPGNSYIMKLFSPRQLHKLFIKERYDIEVSYLEGPSARIISGCPDSNTKLISWIHVEQHTKDIASKAFRSYRESEKCYCKFDKIVCVSKAVKKDFLTIYPMLLDANVLYNTNETDQIIEQKDEPVEAKFLQEDCIRLCGVGKIMPIKGFDKLARIHKKLIDDGFKIHTYILGIGEEKENIERYLKKENIENSFTFLGYQTNPYKYVAKCDMFVCTSEAEGFSTAATEALIVGTPVITTPVAGMEEMLGENNEYGIITENTEDALYYGIKELLNNPVMLMKYKKQAAKRGELFKKEKTVRDVEQMLMSLLVEK